MTPSTEIFLGSYHKDLPWCLYALRSIRKFASGFAGVTLYVPDTDFQLFQSEINAAANMPAVKVVTFQERPGKPMLSHELALCHAERYTSAEYVFHFDSDCVFTEPVTPDDYFVDGKPVLVCEAFSRFFTPDPTNPGKRFALFWKAASEVVLGFEVTHECMVRHPAVHHRTLYPQYRAHVTNYVGRPFDEYVLDCRDEFPQSFAEFTSLGAFARKFRPNEYHWIEIPYQPRPKDKIKQFWSHGGITPEIRAELEQVVG